MGIAFCMSRSLYLVKLLFCPQPETKALFGLPFPSARAKGKPEKCRALKILRFNGQRKMPDGRPAKEQSETRRVAFPNEPGCTAPDAENSACVCPEDLSADGSSFTENSSGKGEPLPRLRHSMDGLNPDSSL